MTSDLDTAEIRDVTLRDGLQLTGKPLSVERRVEVVRELLRSGVSSVEIGSMARPDLVPALAGSLEMVGLLTPEELDRCWMWVATPGHVDRALAAGMANLQYCLSASDAHNRANIGRDTEASLAAMPRAIDAVRAAGGRIQLCVATAFTCPFEGRIPVERVLAIAADPRVDGADEIVVCDTLGQAAPAEVSMLVSRVSAETGFARIGFHGHDTWGQGVANSVAALQAGAAFVDGSLGGLGGCPFAPGASGNAATEDLLFGLRPAWLTAARFAHIADLGTQLVHELGEPDRSRAAHAYTLGAAGPDPVPGVA